MGNYIANKDKTRWMISNPQRLTRTGMTGKEVRCPFCPGNEIDTPPEVYRVGEGEKDKLGWKVRVIPNLFPITDIHEVVVHSPDHNKNIEDLTLNEVEEILKTYVKRFNFLKDKGKVYIFHNNSLSSGASLIHPHSQITVVPKEIPTETLSVQPIVNIIEQNESFISYCPGFSEWPYEVWITCHPTGAKFENFDEKQTKNLAIILQSSIIKLKKIHGSTPQYAKKTFGYNFYIYVPQNRSLDSLRSLGMTGEGDVIPTKDAEGGRVEESFYLRIIPRFMERAGFEMSTGIMVNSVDPKKAAEELKNTK